MNVPAKIGRPSSYSEELGTRICDAVTVAKGGLRGILEADPELPDLRTVMRWSLNNAHFASNLARAREQRLRVWAEDITDISDDDTLDPADKRIRVDTRKWVLSKELARVYGDKLDVTSGGEALTTPAHQIDARVQSIIMMARQRQLASEAVPDEAKSLLE